MPCLNIRNPQQSSLQNYSYWNSYNKEKLNHTQTCFIAKQYSLDVVVVIPSLDVVVVVIPLLDVVWMISPGKVVM